MCGLGTIFFPHDSGIFLDAIAKVHFSIKIVEVNLL
jgi:hypothetical protein